MSPPASKLREIARRIAARRTPDKPALGAYHIDLRSTYRRLRTLTRLASPDDAILFVGDDDLVSLGLSWLGYSRVTLVDIDPDVIERVVEGSEGRVRTVRFDLRRGYDGVWPRLRRDFDLFVTDPPYGEDGLRVFTGFGLRCLRRGGLGYVVHPSRRAPVTSVGDPDLLALTLQRFLSTAGAAVVDVELQTQVSYHGTVSSVCLVRRVEVREPPWATLTGPGAFY